jgi:hypothetical protein
MHIIQPQTFLEFIGGALLIVAVAFAIVSLAPPLRQSSLRLSAINFLAALALFSNYWVTYFAAIFIIATAVTELEFLHILAAIIRGDKNYFDFRREFLTHDEILRKARQDEVIEPSKLKPEGTENAESTPPPTTPRGSKSRIATNAFHVEERALEWFEKEFSLPVQRYLRFSNNQHAVEVDGIIQGKRGNTDTLIEVKWVRNDPPGTGAFSRIIDQVSRLAQRYNEITKRDAELILLLVVPERLPQAAVAQLTERLYRGGVKTKVVFVTHKQLNVSGISDNELPPAA